MLTQHSCREKLLRTGCQTSSHPSLCNPCQSRTERFRSRELESTCTCHCRLRRSDHDTSIPPAPQVGGARLCATSVSASGGRKCPSYMGKHHESLHRVVLWHGFGQLLLPPRTGLGPATCLCGSFATCEIMNCFLVGARTRTKAK